MVNRVLDLTARLLFIAILLVTALYGVMAYVPFVYAQFIVSRLSASLVMFAEWHTVLVWMATLLLAWILRAGLQRRDYGAVQLQFLMTAAAIAVTVHPVLRDVRNDASSLVLAGTALVPCVWLAALDVRAHWRELSWRLGEPDDDRRLWTASAAAALFAWVVYAGVWWSRQPPAGRAAALVASMFWSVSAHGLFFAAVFLVIMTIRGIAGVAPRSSGAAARVEFALGWLALSLAVTAGLARIVFPAITLVGPIAWTMAAALGVTIASVLASFSLLAKAASAEPGGSGMAAWLAPGRRPNVLETAVRMILLAIVAVAAANAAASTDWNFLIQKLTAVLVWIVALRTLFAVSKPFGELRGAPDGIDRRASARRQWPALLAGTALVPLAFSTMVRTADREVADKYANYDPSFRAIYDVIRPSEIKATDTDFYRYLEANTNISRDRHVDPVDVNFIESLQATSGPKPNIFVIVVDSLRRDYLSPYNPAVTFTPAVAAFAAESDVFNHAFTRYGATGLSEPSIWTGGMLVHKQYVTPFAPMNALEKLLTAEQYQQFISLDSILRVLMPPPSAGITELDAGVPNKDYDLCRSLTELDSKIASARNNNAPIFAYTQPQNIHISVITREGKSVPAGEHYEGFYEPYAARVRRLDGCFGTFITSLKTRGLYDSSIVILTADHGDSLGEDGRFGHAYTVFPEVMRIPLLMHVPPALRGRVTTNHEATVFSTDITPTLYSLLGHPPTLTTAPFGRPMFVGAGQTLPPWRGNAVVASSYGTVYGLLRDEGQRLYIVDGVNFRDYSYSLGKGLIGEQQTVTSQERVESQREIREQIAQLSRVYHFDSGK